jgi:pyridoxine/pyridoxamine 5'-phosphate oxidase
MGKVARMAEPTPSVSRPHFPSGYGISKVAEGCLDWDWATERLFTARSYWICTAREDGSPHAAPVWGLWLDNAVVFATSPQSRKGRNLARDTRVAIHLESGDEVVILEGQVERMELNDRVADAYEAKYDFRPDVTGGSDGWYRLHPAVAYAWLEADYPNTATRFAFS